MGKFVTGEVVLVNFPFSDLKKAKLRPALVVGLAEFGDVILVQITSKAYSSKMAISLRIEDFENGTLPVNSFIRPDKIFTADVGIVVKKVGMVSKKIKKEVNLLFKQILINE